MSVEVATEHLISTISIRFNFNTIVNSNMCKKQHWTKNVTNVKCENIKNARRKKNKTLTNTMELKEEPLERHAIAAMKMRTKRMMCPHHQHQLKRKKNKHDNDVEKGW